MTTSIFYSKNYNNHRGSCVNLHRHFLSLITNMNSKKGEKGVFFFKNFSDRRDDSIRKNNNQRNRYFREMDRFRG